MAQPNLKFMAAKLLKCYATLITDAVNQLLFVNLQSFIHPPRSLRPWRIKHELQSPFISYFYTLTGIRETKYLNGHLSY